MVNDAKLAAGAHQGYIVEQVLAMICDSYAHRILRQKFHFAHRKQNPPPKYLGEKSENAG